MTFALLAGLAAGLVHIFSGPDHLAAVAPFASAGGRDRWKAGLQWGLGHTAGVLTIGALLLAARGRLPVDALSAHAERLVGAVLVLIGGWGIRRAMQFGFNPHGHAHAATHPAQGAGEPTGRRQAGAAFATFATGVVHGLAGSSHVFGVLPALALPGRLAAGAYLGGFGLGAVAGMTAFAAAVAWFSSSSRRRHPRSVNGLLYASSAAAVIVGGVWMAGWGG